MPFRIPHTESLNTHSLSRIFNDTVATYKYYWFMSILDLYVSTGNRRLRMWDIIISMIANAWYPIHYFRLSFGKSDSMYPAIMGIRALTDMPIDADRKLIEATLKERFDRGDKELKKLLKVFSLNVPYRFLNPWIRTKDNREMVLRSRSYENCCLYALNDDGAGGFYIDINPEWTGYLQRNYQILVDFTYWNLVSFLQVRNPNVPNIAGKLVRPEYRRSLSRQHLFWDTVIEAGGPIHCIYTGRTLYEGGFDLDHFIPWSFVTHDLAWNLVPSDSSVNSSKSDRIPDLDVFLPGLVRLHRHAITTYLNVGRNSKPLEDYLTLGYSIPDLMSMNTDSFYEVFHRTFSPMVQIAWNMGFEKWDYKTQSNEQ